MAKNIQLGSIVKDRITGFEGVAVGRHEYLTGCNKITVQPQGLTKEGKQHDAQWFDEQSLVVTKAPKAGQFVDVDEEKKPTGGPSEMPRRAL